MEINKMQLEEIREIVLKIGRVRTAQELNNQDFSKLVENLCLTILACDQNKIPEPAASELIAAFLSGDPSKAYRNLVELRSGRSLCDQSDSVGHSALPVDLDKNSYFSFVYRNFNSSYGNSMSRRPNVKSLYLSSGCIEAALRELRSMDFKMHKNDSPAESPTAASICHHLGLIHSVSSVQSLQPQLCAELQRLSYLPVLREFTLSKYVHSQLILILLLVFFIIY